MGILMCVELLDLTRGDAAQKHRSTSERIEIPQFAVQVLKASARAALILRARTAFSQHRRGECEAHTLTATATP